MEIYDVNIVNHKKCKSNFLSLLVEIYDVNIVNHKKCKSNFLSLLVEIYDVNIVNLKGDFELSTEVTKVDKNVLLTIPNPKYQEMLKSHQHLSGITMDEKDEKAELPIHVIIGTNQYPKIKTKTRARIGNQREPIADGDYEQLCRLGVLGLEDQPTGDQAATYEEFKEQLV